MSSLERVDPEVAAIINDERKRQATTLELIASENHASGPVLDALGTVLTDKYAEGYPGRRWYCGCENMDRVESLAIERAKKLFKADHANVQPHSGTTANLAVYLAAIKPGSTILGMNLSHGGHLSHGLSANESGRFYRAVSYSVRQDTEVLDYDQIRQQALTERPAILVCGASAYPRLIDFEALGKIAREAGALMMADVAHIAGLVVADAHPHPFPHADFVTSTTHKTLRGPRGGLILCKQAWAKAVDAAVFPGMQGGPFMHSVAAKAVAFKEAMAPDFARYARAIIANAQTLAGAMAEKGWRIVSGGTDNHLMLIDLRKRLDDVTGNQAANWLAAAGIIANKNLIPYDSRTPTETSGIRLGTPAVTTRGMGPSEMREIATLANTVLMSRGDEQTTRRVRNAVLELCEQFPIPNSQA